MHIIIRGQVILKIRYFLMSECPFIFKTTLNGDMMKIWCSQNTSADIECAALIVYLYHSI